MAPPAEPQVQKLKRRVRLAAWATFALAVVQTATILAVMAGFLAGEIDPLRAIAWTAAYVLLGHFILRGSYIGLAVAAAFGTYRVLLLVGVLLAAAFGEVSQDPLILLRGAALALVMPFFWIRGFLAASKLRGLPPGLAIPPA